MQMHFRVVVLAIAFAVIFGCIRPDYGESWPPDRLLLSAGPQPGYAIKRVIEKLTPATLIGDDGSVCRTSSERFRRTKEGQWIDCIWNLPTLDSTALVKDTEEFQVGRRVAVLD